MKANELMIGDWVMTPNGIARVIMIGEHSPCYTNKTGEGEVAIFPRDLQPIPLTPEIAEKIGFSYGYTASEEGCDCLYEKGWCYSDENGEVKVTFPHGTDGGEIYVNDYSFRTLRLIFPDKIYLHELQHALKLGGIEKKITL